VFEGATATFPGLRKKSKSPSERSESKSPEIADGENNHELKKLGSLRSISRWEIK
jgi:hypothetical protein